jgi:hypothetical protein
MDVHDLFALFVLAGVVVFLFAASRKRRRGHLMPGPGAMGAVYDLLNQDRRHAIEIIVEDKAEARDPEDVDGNLPDLESPKRLR